LLILQSFILLLAGISLLTCASTAGAQEEEIPEGLETVVVPDSEVESRLAEITLVGVPEDVAQEAFNEIVAMGATATPELVAIYESSTETDHRRWVSARALGHIGGRTATETLLRGLQAREFIMRMGAASALGVLQGDEARMALEEALFDPSMEVRCTAADGLADMGHPSSSLPLARALTTPDSFHRGKSLPVRGHIVIALGATGGETAIEALITVLDDSDDALRAMTVKALEEASGANPSGRIGNGVSTTVEERQAWKDWWVRHAQATGSVPAGD